MSGHLAWQVQLGEDGKFRNKSGKILTESAIEQRLRRFTELKRSGVCKGGDELRRMFKEDRSTLVELFKQCNLNKAGLWVEVHGMGHTRRS